MTIRVIRATGSRRSDRLSRRQTCTGLGRPDLRVGVAAFGDATIVVLGRGAGRAMVRRCPQGRVRNDSERSCRRSCTTVRRSCTVAANRSWETSSPRRASGSMRSRPASASAPALMARATTIGTTSTGRWLIPHSARRPARLPGADAGETLGAVVPDAPCDEALPGDDERCDHRGRPSRESDGVADDRRRDERRTDDRTERAARRGPRGA